MELILSAQLDDEVISSLRRGMMGVRRLRGGDNFDGRVVYVPAGG